MSVILMRRWWWLSLVLLLPSPPKVDCRNVTHEDIRDAMLSLVHMFRTSEDKLERHEYREKGLGDQLKKMLVGLEKRHRALEPLKGMISRLDERLSNVETILLQREERDKTNAKKTNDALENIQMTLQAMAGGASIDGLRNEVEGLKNRLSKESLRSMCLEVTSKVNPLEKHISEAEKLLNKYELKLNEYGNSSKVQTDFVPLNEVSLADEAWHSKMTEVMERQEGEVRKIRHLLSDAEGLWKELPRRADLQQAQNYTLDAIEQNTRVSKDAVDQSIATLSSKLREVSDRLSATNEDIQRSLTQSNTMSERALSDVTKGYDKLQEQVSSLAKSEQVLVSTADNVIANRKRIEYGVHQVLMEVGDMLRQHAATANHTLTDRLDLLETRVTSHTQEALRNVSAAVEGGLGAVWRQVGVMYQQLSDSKASLDKLTGQTENYVNGSNSTMDSMKDKVGAISTRMTEVDENLNYLLGRLSLVTQEFAQLKTGLGTALDELKQGLNHVHSTFDKGPGPHNITSSETTTVK